MKKLNQFLAMSAAVLILSLGQQKASAQPGPPDFANFDPQQMQQQMQKRLLENVRTRLVVTNNDEWLVIEARLSKVIQVRMESMMSSMGGMMGGMGGGMGGMGGGERRFPGFGQPNPDAEALQKAIESKAPTEQIKSALARFRESRKQKDNELAKAREQLRQVLSLRQEAVLVSMGLLD